MRKVFSGFCVFLLMAASHAHAGGVDDLGWLAGCWTMSKDGRVTEETWLRPAGGIAVGVGRTLRDGALRQYEFMRIDVQNGALTFTAIPSGQAQASFPAISQTTSEIVFENKAHDFPQTITYRSPGPDALYAAIQGPVNGNPRTIEFTYNRCEAK
ncbi:MULTISPECIES: DUF6265 family protein [Asticcacaulis]|uniref:DUF6265 family protein n=1 Tax=Asticcacaulis TaxID=76890 RepID=UPI001AE1398C|nr:MULTISPECIES: DUF6265 family protein [Asticcacaulis]MBP2158514.1 hypothetical protein [Asticcacaulis solisilvae]MDR6799560.1 hypothetical protein [Asticcacaulis sp. BE141]